MRNTSPTVDVTKDALIIRIPWKALRTSLPQRGRQSALSATDVLSLVAQGRHAHHAGRAKLIGSLRELMT